MARHYGHPQPKKKRTARAKVPLAVVLGNGIDLSRPSEEPWWQVVKIVAGTVSLFALVVIVFVLAMWLLGAVGWA